MTCSGCEIHAAVYGVVNKRSAKPKDDAIPTSSRKVAAPVIEEEGDRTIPAVVGKLDSPANGGSR